MGIRIDPAGVKFCGLAQLPIECQASIAKLDKTMLFPWTVQNLVNACKLGLKISLVQEALPAPNSQLLMGTCNAQDVAWHQIQPAIFGSVGDDHRCILWDLRNNGELQAPYCALLQPC